MTPISIGASKLNEQDGRADGRAHGWMETEMEVAGEGRDREPRGRVCRICIFLIKLVRDIARTLYSGSIP